VAAADVLIYLGDLAPVFAGARHALRAGGLFGFSVEASDAEDFVLRPTLRYAHSVAYLRELAASHQFVFEFIEPRIIRKEKGSDVDGFHAILRRS
jgi:predicted TPR repeat methyltransferase